MAKHKVNKAVKGEAKKKNKRNVIRDDENYRSQAGSPTVTSEDKGGQYHDKKDKLGKVKDRNAGKGHRAPDLSKPNVEGGTASVYENGNRVPKASRIKEPKRLRRG